MRMPKRIFTLTLLGATVVVAFGWLLRPGKFLRFKHRGDQYYAALALSCDTMLALYPLGTNRFLEIPNSDLLVPGMVRDLHPWRTKVSTDWVWILVNGSHSRDGLVLVWEPQYGQTNIW